LLKSSQCEERESPEHEIPEEESSGLVEEVLECELRVQFLLEGPADAGLQGVEHLPLEGHSVHCGLKYIITHHKRRLTKSNKERNILPTAFMQEKSINIK
jgi:hypothetical protein